METLLIFVLLLMLLAAAAPGLYALRRRMAAGERALEIWQVLQRRGLASGDALDAGGRALASAVRRCALCPSVRECDEWLASGRREGLDAFCPNAAYLKRLERP